MPYHPSSIHNSLSALGYTQSEPSSAYVLVTPVRNEEKYIEQTLISVVHQTILPNEWIIVSDGSTDDTDNIINQYAAKHDWIRLITLPERENPSFAAVVQNTTLGINNLETQEYKYLGLLDSDLRFENDYFERLITEFENDQKLGLAGGVAIDIGSPRNVIPRNRKDVPGALQFFRRECFSEIGGLTPIPEGGWDCITCASARMNGWQTKLITSLVVDHLKPRNITQGSRLKRKWQLGVRDYALGYHPLFEILKCASRIAQPPVLLGSASWLLGYFTSAITRNKRTLPNEIVNFIRKEQCKRLLGSS